MRNNIAIVLLCLSVPVNAQFYVKPAVGYSVGLNPVEMKSTLIFNDIKTETVSKIYNGQGLNLGLSAGYDFSNNFSFEIGGCTQVFTTQHISSPQLPDLSRLTSYSYYYSNLFGNITHTNSIFQFYPQLVSRIDCQGINFYIKTGPNFTFVKTKILQDNTTWDWKPVSYHVITGGNEKGRIEMGFQASVGIEYQVSEKLNLFAELLTVHANYKFREYETEKYEIDGVDHLSDLDKRSGSIDGSYKVDFSNIGFNIGIKYMFNKKTNNN